MIFYRPAKKNPKIKLRISHENRDFGGAFDPIHKGHIYMAQKAMEEYSLDRILLVPSGHSPNKTENAMTAFSHRYNMCKLASEAVPGIEVSDIEIKDESTSYTYVTLKS